MYSNNYIPNYRINTQRRGFGLNRRDDRIFSGGFAVPFLLGGITGGLLAQPNNFYGGYQRPYPIPIYINNPYPYYTENYYYY